MCYNTVKRINLNQAKDKKALKKKIDMLATLKEEKGSGSSSDDSSDTQVQITKAVKEY